MVFILETSNLVLDPLDLELHSIPCKILERERNGFFETPLFDEWLNVPGIITPMHMLLFLAGRNTGCADLREAYTLYRLQLATSTRILGAKSDLGSTLRQNHPCLANTPGSQC